MVFTTDPLTIKPGQIWADLDERNAVTRGKNGRPLRHPKPRLVEILTAPTLSMPGSFRVIEAPRLSHTVGKVHKFSRDKLVRNYGKVR